MRIRNPKIKRALMTGMACLSTVIAVLSFTLKLPQAFLDGQNSLSVLAAGLTAPDGARNLFAQRGSGKHGSPVSIRTGDGGFSAFSAEGEQLLSQSVLSGIILSGLQF